MIFVYLLLTLSPFSADKVEIIRHEEGNIIRLLGDVIIDASTAKIFCQEATIYEFKDLAVLHGAVRIIDTSSTIEADTAYHYLSDERSLLKGNVILKKAARTIYADSLVYFGRRDYTQAFGQVKFTDSTQKLTARGDHGTYDLRQGRGYLEGSPRALIERENKSPIEVNSRIFEFIEKSNSIIAYDSVKVTIDSTFIEGDSLRYFLDKKEGLITNLTISEQRNNIIGDSGRFTLGDDRLEEFKIRNGHGVYLTKEGTKNEVDGGLIVFQFKDGRIYAIEVSDKPKGILYLRK